MDIIWGNGASVLSKDSLEINVTHQKDGNKAKYNQVEKVKITEADLPGLSQNQSEWTEESLKTSILDAFLKCEIKSRDESGILLAKVSHSGVGGY